MKLFKKEYFATMYLNELLGEKYLLDNPLHRNSATKIIDSNTHTHEFNEVVFSAAYEKYVLGLKDQMRSYLKDRPIKLPKPQE